MNEHVVNRMKRRKRPQGQELKGMRSCIACRNRAERISLVRIVLGPDGRLQVDRYLKAPGRGAHLCYAVECFDVVTNAKILSRAFKRAAKPADPERVRLDVLAAVEARIDDMMSIGRGAGWVLSGTDTLIKRGGRLNLLVLAEDIADDTERKLRAAIRKDDCSVVVYGDAVRLGGTQRQSHRVAIGVSNEMVAARLKAEIERRRRVLVAA